MDHDPDQPITDPRGYGAPQDAAPGPEHLRPYRLPEDATGEWHDRMAAAADEAPDVLRCRLISQVGHRLGGARERKLVAVEFIDRRTNILYFRATVDEWEDDTEYLPLLLDTIFVYRMAVETVYL